MALLQNSAEGYATTGTTVTAGNSGGGSGDAFTLVTATTAATVTAVNTDHAHGSWCYSVVETTAANNSIIGWSGLSVASVAARFYIKFNTLPSAGAARLRIFAVRNSAGNVLTVDVLTTNKLLVSIANANQSTGWTGALTTGQWYRVEAEVTTGATGTGDGYAAVRYYLLDSTTPVESAFTNTAASTGSAALTEVRFGKLDNNGYADLKIDDAASNAGSASPIGPFSASVSAVSLVAAAGSGRAVAAAVDAETVVSGGGPAAGSGRAVPVIVGAGGAGATVVAAQGSGRAVAVRVGTAPLLSAVPDPTNSPPRIILTVGAASGTTVTVARIDAQGNSVPVRAADPATLTSGSWVGFDYEAPYGEPVTYTATTDVSAAVPLSTTVQLDVTQPWLIHPGIPSLSRPLEVSAMPAPTRPSNRGLYAVLGRADAVARSDGQRKSRTFDLAVRTYTAADEDGLDTLIEDDSVLLLQIVDPRIYRTLYAWVSVGDVARTPMATYLEGWLDWTLPCTEAARPSGLLQSQRTWADVVADYPTWADVLAAYPTWRDLITGAAS